MSQPRLDLTLYEVAYLAGGPARVTETAAAELLRRHQLTIGPAGLLARAPAAPPGLPAPGRTPAAHAAHDLEQQILGLASRPGGLSLPRLRRRCGLWRPVRQIGSLLAAAGLAFARRQRRVALALALALLAACAVAAGAIAAGWRAAPTARSPLAAVVAVLVAGLLGRAFQRTTGEGRRKLADTGQLTRQLLALLRPTGMPVAQPATAAGWAAVTPEDVVSVALTGLAGIPDPDLRARLGQASPRGGRSRAAPVADESLAADLKAS
jgi:uncharacterized protein (TIGR04222 family)